jgi:hypothetical protein
MNSGQRKDKMRNKRQNIRWASLDTLRNASSLLSTDLEPELCLDFRLPPSLVAYVTLGSLVFLVSPILPNSSINIDCMMPATMHATPQQTEQKRERRETHLQESHRSSA